MILKKILNSQDKKRLFSNFFYLLISQGFNYLLPLITFPYLARVLGPEKFGLIAFVQAFIQYFVIFSDFGFSLSATREVSIYRENKRKLEEIFNAIMFIKLILILISFILLLLIVFSFEKFRQYWQLYFLSFGLVIGQALFPIWFFQGLEKMKYITILNIISKLIFTVSIFIFVKNQFDYWKVPLLNSISILLTTFLTIYLIITIFKFRLGNFKFNNALFYTKKSFLFFLSRFSITIYTNSINIILGMLYNYKVVSYYEISYKIISILRQPWDILNTILYPYMSKTKNFSLLGKVITLSFIISIVIFAIFYFSAPYIFILLFGSNFAGAVHYFRILLFILPLISIHIFLGSSTLAASGYSKFFNLSNLVATSSFIILVLIFYLLNLLTIKVLLYLIVLVDLIILVFRLFYIWKLGILNQLIKGVFK